MVKLKDMQYALPEFLSAESKDLINHLLAWDPTDRYNIHQVRAHPFIKGSKKTISEYFGRDISPIPYLDSDCSYYEYTESLVSPKLQYNSQSKIAKRVSNLSQSNSIPIKKVTPLKRTFSIGPSNKENQCPNKIQIKQKLTLKMSPLSTQNLDPIKHKLKNGELEITDDGWVRVYIGKRKLEVSGDGLTVLYQGHMLSLKNMRRTPARLYELARNFLEIVRTKTPKITIQERNARCMLMRNTPFPNYEVDFDDGIRVTFQVGSENFAVYQLDGKEIFVNPYQDLDHLDTELASVIEVSMEGLKKCLLKERETVLSN